MVITLVLIIITISPRWFGRIATGWAVLDVPVPNQGVIGLMVMRHISAAIMRRLAI